MSHLSNLRLKAPVSEAEIQSLPSLSRLPSDYIEFLRRSNGASGFVGNAYLSVYEAETIDALNRAGGIEERAQGLIVFASDGGGI